VTHSPEIALLLRWCDLTLTGLGAAREEIDALNVYPVPDGDTGTNLYLTFEAARTALVESRPVSLVDALTVFANGALVGARGNSGVILSQLLRAGADQLLRGDPHEPGRLLADTITRAARAAYAAVGTPVEGTILSVAGAASDAAQRALADAPRELAGQMAHVITAAAAAAREALQRTPDQLETLRLAGVVDAGGRGLCVVFDAAEEAFTGRRPAVSPSRRPRPLPSPVAPVGGRQTPAGPAYEVMYLLDAEEAAVNGLRRALGGLGESLVVVGGDGLWNVHVHVDDVGAAVEAGIEAGRPHRVRVTHLADHHESTGPCGAPGSPSEAHRRGVVAVSAGRGLAELFAQAGAAVVEAGPGHRCSTGDILEAIHATRSDSVIILPNDGATVAVAEAAARAARDVGVRAAVIPSRAQVQGLAAIAVHEPGRSFDDDVVHMTSAAGHARDGAVTVALRDAMTSAGPCREGDVLGVVGGDFAIVGDDLTQTAIGVVERLLSAGGEMLTLVSGADADADLLRRVRSHVEQTRPMVDVVVYAGGQDRYPLLMGVE
jgi:DAK2 domain fusion protein YloV